jgi:hypothetical protein
MRLPLALAACLLACCPQPSAAAQHSSALVVFVGPSAKSTTALALIDGLDVSILSATQGTYRTSQFLLDVTQGARVSDSAYDRPQPATLGLATGREGAADGQILPWGLVVKHARSAPQLLLPGLLAGQVPGGGAYVGIAKQSLTDALLAAGTGGRVASVWLGSAGGLLTRLQALRAYRRLTVADLPSGPSGYEDLRALLRTRPAGELLLAIERPTNPPLSGPEAHGLLWIAAAGVGATDRTLSSQTTNERGLIAAIDLAPSILNHLGLAVPSQMRGAQIHTDGGLNIHELSALRTRLAVISGRRLPALATILLAWLLLAIIMTVIDQRRRANDGRRWAMRVGALALLWSPVGVLITAALQPTRAGELALLAALCLSLGVVTDRLIAWPRAPIAPALVAVGAIVLDALAHTQLLMRSLLGPNPAFGARFYGIGNELKSALAVLVLCAVASARYPSVRSNRSAGVMALAGVTLAIVEGSARIGAGVGGVILVSAGTALTSVMLLPGTVTRKRLLWVLIAPLAGLLGLVVIDLLSAHGGGHFTGSVLHARSAEDVRDILVRRYGAAWDELKNHAMPFATALALVAGVWSVMRRERLCAPVAGDPGWIAALCGGFAAGLIGAFSEDSGPVLLVVASGTLACMLAYLWGSPRGTASAVAIAADATQHDLVL